MAQKGLGKGLSALISENPAPKSVSASGNTPDPATEENGVRMMGVTLLHAGEFQPRTRFDEVSLSELSESIQQNGVIQPLIIRESDTHRNKYEIIAGERRWRASKMAGLDQVPVIIREVTDQQALEFALIENIQRHDLSPLEEAIGYQRLIEEFEYTQEELAGTVGKSRSHVANLLRLLSLPDEVKELLDKGELTMGHARALLTAENPVDLAKKIVKNGLNVRQAERFSKGAGTTKRSNPAQNKETSKYKPPINKDPDIVALEESLAETMGVKVTIHDHGQSGEIVLAYDSLVQLDEILQRLGNRLMAI